MCPSIDFEWCHARAVTLLAFYENIEPLVVFVVLGLNVVKMIPVRIPTFSLATILNFYPPQSFVFSVRLAFL